MAITKPFDVSKFRKSITKSIDGISVGFNDPTDWISTNNYALNYLISGDFTKGIPMGKVTVFAGESGAGKSLANGTAVAGIDGRSGWHVRFRSGQLSSEGFLWENQSETALMHLAADTGNLYLKGNVYVGNSASDVVIHTTSTTGINASALSTGTVPLAQLSSANSSANGVVDTTTQTFAGNKTFLGTTTINALSANGGVGTSGQFLTSNGSATYWSTLTVVDANSSTSGLVNTNSQTFAGNTTFDNNVAIIGYLTVGNSTITLNSTTLVLGNASSNLVMNSSSVSLDGSQIINSSGTANNATNLNGQPATYYTNASNISSGTLAIARLDANVLLTTSTTGINASALSTGTVPDGRLSGTYTNITANNATYAFGKTEGALNVNSAVSANNTTYAFGKTEGALNVNNATTATTANNATYAFGKTEGALNVNSATTATTANNKIGRAHV